MIDFEVLSYPRIVTGVPSKKLPGMRERKQRRRLNAGGKSTTVQRIVWALVRLWSRRQHRGCGPGP